MWAAYACGVTLAALAALRRSAHCALWLSGEVFVEEVLAGNSAAAPQARRSAPDADVGSAGKAGGSRGVDRGGADTASGGAGMRTRPERLMGSAGTAAPADGVGWVAGSSRKSSSTVSRASGCAAALLVVLTAQG
ncbi:hypothetical protein HaLaN_30529 [Haematococcus lacustris]|uniref:Secreted protein n=1 Tax=Haematococcus lacustris TaxID=44745 RepID=A0A6A0AFP0_HAELA|nr:hypothetical protein HaLaN_30529 [Haematococcus lacustris]